MNSTTGDEDMSRATVALTELEEEPAASSGLPATTKTLPPTNALSKLFGSDSDSEADAQAHAPRSQLLTRLQPQQTDESSESEDDGDGEGAYERIKKALMSGQDARRKDGEATQSPPLAEPSSTEDEDDMPVKANAARRKLPPRESTPPPVASPSGSVPTRQSSPGLFVTPTATPTKTAKVAITREESDSDTSTKRNTNRDLQERVKRIRAQRQAAERKGREEAKTAANARPLADQESDSDPDGENGRRLTQQTRPTRKAGKRALEEMARDQQRISRNMQLAHQAKTKKKYGTKDLFAKFGFNQPDTETIPGAALPTPDPSFLSHSSDVEINQHHDTPPTSPPSQEDLQKQPNLVAEPTLLARDDEIQAAAVLSTSVSPLLPRVDKGKGRAPEFQHLPPKPAVERPKPTVIRPARNTIEQPAITDLVELSDSEDDLQVVKPKSRFPVFDRLPQRQQREGPSMLHLRHLAHLASPSKKAPKGRSTMHITDLQFSLGLKARQQAQKARQEKIEELKRRGVHIETEEEREKHQIEIEDLVAQFEKARQEDLKLAKLEKAEAKKNGEGGDGLVSSDESEDEDYVASDGEENRNMQGQEEDGEEEAVELSGSEDEDMADADDEEDLDDEDSTEKSNGLIDDAAEDDEDDEDSGELLNDAQVSDGGDVDEDDVNAPIRKPTVKRSRNVIVDDEDDSQDEALHMPASTQEPSQPPPTIQTQGNDAMAAFGFGKSSETLGLTQMFAGTMADVDADSQNAHPLDKEMEQDSLDFLRALPDSQPTTGLSQTADLLVPNSQAFESQDKAPLFHPVSEIDLGISQLIETSPAFSHTQLSQDPEPTQDAGFKLLRSPTGVVPPPSTVETIMMPVADSPVVKRKGRLQQGKRMIAAELSDVDDDVADLASEVEEEEESLPMKASDAFAVLKKGAKKQKRIADNFNKKTSWARDAIEEQAEESEDEYAGIGGASDDDSGEEDEEVKKMIDESDVKVDERKLAAFFAEKAKKEDEKNLNQLYKDVMNGGLRKRHAVGAFDVSDSEDETEQRRRKKQAQFRQMTKALISDEKIASVASNPKKSAFFNTLADHFEDPEYDRDFLETPAMGLDNEEPSQSQSQPEEGKEGQDTNTQPTAQPTIPDSQITSTTAPVNPLKRKSPDSQEKENRPPPHLRRTAASTTLARKPITIADIQHSVSELLDDPRVMVPDSQFSESESELEIEDAPAAIKAAARKPRAVIDRLTLSRTASIESNDTAVAGNMAFHAPGAGAHQPGFKVPSLIRRATSNLSIVSTGSSGASTPTEGSGVRRGGGARSNIHAQAREAERRAAVDKVERRRKEHLKKKVGMARGKRSVLGCLDGGFE
ncbi:hypothetical protein K491DRAFT_630538 [Lophiostoma macrostomum CBS 122681]|uniref:DNA replication checkpoint mediator MRC1 domain-containing protein n=1 Tax=Lophiostoma macrostomum CBS 122681 TaxID=1314788 RepID=A0A6A6T597_9PLEO|nr:hypothetical protein K491DRAFT_630538 [Lophiostoma macrostomum CBS 122681]